MTGMLNKTDKVNSGRFRYLMYISDVKNGYLCNGILKDKKTSRCLVKKKTSLMGHINIRQVHLTTQENNTLQNKG